MPHLRIAFLRIFALSASLAVVGFSPRALASDSATKTPAANASASPIRLNTIGFLPDAPKRATIAADCTKFTIVSADDGAVVFSASVGPAITTAKSDTDETVHVADFSALTTPGTYQLDVPGVGRSARFRIGSDVWNAPFAAVTRAFYLWRCGTEVHAELNGQTFGHVPCHVDDGWLDEVGGGHVRRPGTGGWHDAGDYNKYVVNAGVTVGFMLHAWEQYPGALAGVKLALPESGNGTPDLLNEVRWELEWLFAMQMEDGRVYHKLSSHDFRFWGPAEKDLDPRYFSPWSSTATADFTAMLAAAARVYRPYDAAFADRCLVAARRSWVYLVAHPEDVDADLHAFHTGGYGARDESHRLWAAAELWATTGEIELLRDFERRARSIEPDLSGPTWGDVRDLAIGTYLLAHAKAADRDPKLVTRLSNSVLALAARIVFVAGTTENAYARPLGIERSEWYWGANGTVASQTYLLQLANRLHPDSRYRAAALDALGFLFGRNYYARSFVTGVGSNPPAHPHDRRGEPAWPGNLVGGGWPTGRDWIDNFAKYEVNEIAINWNGALLYAIAPFVEPAK